MKKLLFCYDGSAQARSAMADFAPASLPTPVHAVVITVADVWMPPDAQGRVSKTARAAFAEARRTSSEGARRLRGLFPDWQVSSEAIADSPGWGILKRAEELDVDLIALGPHSQPPIFDRFFFGSIASEIVGNAPCSVRVCRPRELQNPVLRIIVAVDGSDDSARAVQEFTERDWPRDAQFRIVTVLDSKIQDALRGSLFAESADEYFAGVVDSIAELPGRLATELRDKGKFAQAAVIEGNPKTEIVRIADLWNADCIFIGARGLDHRNRRHLGTVASAIARRASCSVEICRPKSRAK